MKPVRSTSHDQQKNWQLHLVSSAGNEALPVYFIRRRARYLRIYITASGEVRVTVPGRTGRKEAEAFALQHRDWVDKILCERRVQPSLVQWLQSGNRLIWGGASRRSKVEWRSGKTARALGMGDEVVFFLPDEQSEWLARELIVRHARRYLPQRTRALAEKHRVSVGRVTVRDQSTRWGSCSTAGTISLNWRLLLLPLSTADGVILHELAHRREMNHSQRFYTWLDELDPQRKINEASLHEHGCLLMQLGRG